MAVFSTSTVTLPALDDYTSARLISQVLTLYYVEEKNQAQVAKILGLSTAKVNRLIKQARAQGMVEIHLRTPFQELFELERQVQTVCGIPEAVIIPQLSEDADVTLQTIGPAAADYLLQHVRNGDVICISGGKALYAIIHALNTKKRYDVTVVPATGGYQGRHYYDVNYLAGELATRLGGKAYQLHAPVLVDTPEEREALLSVRQISSILDLSRQARIAIVGVGSVMTKSSSYFELPFLSASDKKKIVKECGGSGEILAYLYNSRGHLCAQPFNRRVIGITPQELRAIPLRIGVAASQEKELPIYGALRGKYLTTIITDGPTARGVLERYEREPA